MKNIETISSRTNCTNVVHGEFRLSLLARAIARIRIWHQHRIAIRQLNSLSDRMLDDIGIDRFHISAAVKTPGLCAHHITRPTSRPELSARLRRAA